MCTRDKKIESLNDFLIEDAEEMLEYFEWISDVEDEESEVPGWDTEWARAIADIEEFANLDEY